MILRHWRIYLRNWLRNGIPPWPRTSRVVLWGHRGLDRSPERRVAVTITVDIGPAMRVAREFEAAFARVERALGYSRGPAK